MTDEQQEQTATAGPAERRIAELENELAELYSANRFLVSVATYFARSDARGSGYDGGGMASRSPRGR
ncbi:hypothetical protein QWM81_08545 [Streptomyces ficellus]|uniref:Transposase n=1 Tax=Streptomyces ficellus TaxID=1977088 RepID=A0ABT7Z3M8_9ACTN|nr:hypothetical protein [Streptomyces ficellus]MDN3294095.1 hypothetical protein [Streptomyces ficellus]